MYADGYASARSKPNCDDDGTSPSLNRVRGCTLCWWATIVTMGYRSISRPCNGSRWRQHGYGSVVSHGAAKQAASPGSGCSACRASGFHRFASIIRILRSVLA